jgi:hypothetical protein
MIENVKTPEVSPLATDAIVAVPTDKFYALILKLNEVIGVVNSLITNVETHTTELSECRQNLSNVAKILEELYDEA